MADLISMTRDQAEEAMKQDGMLAPVIEEFRPAIEHQHAKWFDFADRANKRAVAVWVAHSNDGGGLTDTDPINLVILLMARCLDGFAASVVLARRGMTVEVGTLARAIYETAFWIAYFAKDPEAANKDFEIDHYESERGRLQEFEWLHAADTEKLAQVQADLATVNAKLGKSRKIGIKALAIAGDVQQHFPYYKVLCGMAAHSSKKSIGHYVRYGEDGVHSIQFGVDADGVHKTLIFSCHGLMVALNGFLMMTKDDAADWFIPLWDEKNNLMDEAAHEMEAEGR